MPNVIAGILIGIGNDSWTTVIGVSFVWGVVWIVWAIVRNSEWLQANVQRGMVDKEWSKPRAYVMSLSIEYVTAVITVLPISCITFLIKSWIT